MRAATTGRVLFGIQKYQLNQELWRDKCWKALKVIFKNERSSFQSIALILTFVELRTINQVSSSALRCHGEHLLLALAFFLLSFVNTNYGHLWKSCPEKLLPVLFSVFDAQTHYFCQKSGNVCVQFLVCC